MQKGVLRNFTKFTEKHLCLSLFFNKVAGLFLQNTSGDCFCILSMNGRVEFQTRMRKLILRDLTNLLANINF